MMQLCAAVGQRDDYFINVCVAICRGGQTVLVYWQTYLHLWLVYDALVASLRPSPLDIAHACARARLSQDAALHSDISFAYALHFELCSQTQSPIVCTIQADVWSIGAHETPALLHVDFACVC